MGIDHYHTWLKQKFPGIYIPLKNNNIYEYIYIDTNFILHNSIYNCATEEEFLFKISMKLDTIFTNFIALKQIFISLDGPAPFAKMMLQRKRRTQNSTETEINCDEINSLWLTPGTNAMNKIVDHILKYIEQLKLSYKFIKPEIILSSSNEPGEGEIKICKQIISNYKNNLLHRHLLIGNDSDLILLAMSVKPIYNINIMITSRFGNEMISIEKLLHLHCKKINKDNTIIKLSNSSLRDDFVLISILMGNDYLPKLGYINHDKLWKIYYDFMARFSKNTIINTKNGVIRFNKTNFSLFMYKIFVNIPKTHQKININTFNSKRTKSYLKGLLWCLTMYKQGFCPDYNYSYNYDMVHPYELLFYLTSNTKNLVALTIPDQLTVPAELYPLIVMPKSAMSLIDKKYYPQINGQLSYLYKEDHIFCINDIHKIISLNK